MPKAQPTLAKLTRPRLHAPVKRTRLFKLLDQRKRYPIVWVSGPPGSGKTTLVASYLEARKANTFWCQVDEADRDPASFFYYLGKLASAHSARAKRLPALSAAQRLDIAGFARRFFRDLFVLLGSNAELVFDNCHTVADASFEELLRVAAEQVPETVYLYFISRNAPGENMARTQVSGGMLHLDGDDLRLTLQEAQQLAGSKIGSSSHDAVARLYNQCDGWLAGFVLMWRDGSGTDAPSANPKSREALFRYFASEVLSNLAIDERDQLLSIALMPRFTLAMAVQLGGSERIEEIVRTLYERRYFVNRAADADPHYQFHDLFREFLLTRWSESRTAQDQKRLQHQAGYILEEDDQIEQALGMYVAAHAWERATAIILRLAPAMLEHGRWQTLAEWLSALPASLIDEHPWLGLWHAEVVVIQDPKSGYDLFAALHQRFVDSGDAVGQALAAAGATLAIWPMGATFFLFDRWIPILVDLVERHPNLPPEVRFRLWARFCDASWLRQSGHPLIPQGRQTLLEERAKRSFRNREYPLLINSLAEIAHADCDSALGQRVDSHSKCTTFSGAEDFMRRQEVEALAGSMIELIDD